MNDGDHLASRGQSERAHLRYLQGEGGISLFGARPVPMRAMPPIRADRQVPRLRAAASPDGGDSDRAIRAATSGTRGDGDDLRRLLDPRAQGNAGVSVTAFPESGEAIMRA